MQAQPNTLARPAELKDWDEVEPGWWYAIARDETEVHVQADKDLGWSVMTMRGGDIVSLPSYDQDLGTVVAQALDLLSRHDLRLVA